ncbi:MAG: alanine racemase [Phycisphaerae bacterium]|nr:alanine racemase [Phycisphaerae bacterium]
MPEPATAYISTAAIRGNVEAVRRRIPPGTPVCVAVKADAYGHGLAQVLPALDHAGVERLAVANLDEANELRALGWTRPVLCLGPIFASPSQHDRSESAAEAVAGGIAVTVISPEEARLLAAAAHQQHRLGHVEIQVDTGMGRCGVRCDRALDVVAQAALLPDIRVDGVYMHFATADEEDLTFARTQLRDFKELIAKIASAGLPVGSFHAANSAAVFRLPESHLDLIRPGLCIYGYWGGPANQRPADLRPILRLVGRLTELRRLPAGASVGYGSTWTAKRDSLIGTVALGYADGYRRLLGNKAVVGSQNAQGGACNPMPVVGRVSMDQINVDLTDAGPVAVGDQLVVIDDDPSAPNSVESLATLTGSIPYEITTLMGRRVRRVSVP